MSANTDLKSVLERSSCPKVSVTNVRRVDDKSATIARFALQIDGWGTIVNWALAARKSDGELFVSGPTYRGAGGQIRGHCFPMQDVKESILKQVLAALESAAA